METRLKWLTQIFVDCNRFNKGELNEVLSGPLKEYSNKRCKDKTMNQIDRDNSNDTNKYSHKQDKASKQGVIERTFLLKQLS